MKEQLYKNCVYSFILINFWTLYGFFDFYLAVQSTSWFHGMGLLMLYFNSIIVILGLGLILLFIRLIFHLMKKKNILKANFIYTFTAIFSLNLVMIGFVCITLDMLTIDSKFVLFLLALIVIASIIVFDIYKSNFKTTR